MHNKNAIIGKKVTVGCAIQLHNSIAYHCQKYHDMIRYSILIFELMIEVLIKCLIWLYLPRLFKISIKATTHTSLL